MTAPRRTKGGVDRKLKRKQQSAASTNEQIRGDESLRERKRHDSIARFQSQGSRILNTINPRAPENLVKFSIKDAQMKRIEVDQTVVLLDLMSSIANNVDSANLAQQETNHIIETVDDDGLETESTKREESSVNDANQLLISTKNQFDFLNWSSQTPSNTKHCCIQVDPINKENLVDSVTQLGIYNAYLKAVDLKRAEPTEQPIHNKQQAWPVLHSDTEFSNSKSLLKGLEILERLVIRNADDATIRKLTDEGANEDGSSWTLLWKIHSGLEHGKQLQVTAVEWNLKYKDFFAVGLGNYDFGVLKTGAVYCYSLKNILHPEYCFPTPSAVCSLSWHPNFSPMLAVGLKNGTVHVYDLRLSQSTPICGSEATLYKHVGACTDVQWVATDPRRSIRLHSISDDTRMTTWTTNRGRLQLAEEVDFGYSCAFADTAGYLSCVCFAFHPFRNDLFLIGMEAGQIHKCSTFYRGMFLETYEGHQLPVYSLQWNKVQPQVFLSASVDWTVRIWDAENNGLLLVFDIWQPVADANWAPKSSTVFAVAGLDGTVYIYDLSLNRYDHVSSYKLPKKTKLTRIAFNDRLPILLVGDEAGYIACLKVPQFVQPSLREAVGIDLEKVPDNHVWQVTAFIESIRKVRSHSSIEFATAASKKLTDQSVGFADPLKLPNPRK